MVQVELLPRQYPGAVLAGVPVALEDVVAGELEFLAGQLVEEGQQDHPGQADRPARRVDRLEFGDGRIAHREVDPIHHRKCLEVILLMVNDMSMPSRQERECPARADHVHRLP